MVLHHVYCVANGFAPIILVRAKDAGNRFFAVKRSPDIIGIMIVQEAGSKTNAQACRDVGQGGIVVSAVEIVYPNITDHTLLHFV